MTPIPPPDPVCIPRIGRRVSNTEPRKIRHVPLPLPKRATLTRFSSAMWVGKAEIDADGSVVNVRTMQPVKTDPPWPEWEEAFPAAIRQWKYEPVCVNGQPVRFEVTVTGNIDF